MKWTRSIHRIIIVDQYSLLLIPIDSNHRFSFLKRVRLQFFAKEGQQTATRSECCEERCFPVSYWSLSWKTKPAMQQYVIYKWHGSSLLWNDMHLSIIQVDFSLISTQNTILYLLFYKDINYQTFKRNVPSIQVYITTIQCQLAVKLWLISATNNLL